MDVLAKKATQILLQGGIVIFPTDTAFGIGCRIDDDQAIDRLFALRKRPKNQATPVLVTDKTMAIPYYLPLNLRVENLMDTYWPGGLTIVYPCQTEKVNFLVRGGGKNIGMRVPNHQMLRSIIKTVGVPILGPSANFHGFPTPFTISELDPNLVKLVDFVLPGECVTKQSSTVIDCSQKTWRILRQGALYLNDKKNTKSGAILTIDTSDSSVMKIGLIIANDAYEIPKEAKNKTSQMLLPTIESQLKKHHLSPNDISAIRISQGPGSFTGLRVGLSIANALGFLLGIPVNSSFNPSDAIYSFKVL